MSCVQNILTCKFAGCKELYDDARILPCGKRTCAAHILDEMIVTSDENNNNAERKMIKCHFCEEMHSLPEHGNGFPVDTNLALLLMSMYGRGHVEAKNNYKKATQLIDTLTRMDKEAFVVDYFERVEAAILLEREVIRTLDAHYQKLVDEVRERKLQCLHNLRTHETLDGELDAIKQTLVEQVRKFKHSNPRVFLSALDGEEGRLRRDSHKECAKLLDKVKSVEKDLKEKIIGQHMIEFKPGTQLSPVDSICGILVKGAIDSTILSSRKMKRDLVKLCMLSDIVEFKLIYRATRDGFQSSAFHDKCDHQPNTLTIIKTTRGCIFGGFTSVGWDSSSGWRADPHACLFTYSACSL